MHRHQNAHHTCVRAAAGPGPRIPKRLVPNRLRRCHIPRRINCISRFEPKPFLENILESKPGGGGATPATVFRNSSLKLATLDAHLGATLRGDPEAEVTSTSGIAAWPSQAGLHVFCTKSTLISFGWSESEGYTPGGWWNENAQSGPNGTNNEERSAVNYNLSHEASRPRRPSGRNPPWRP
jgi:hypothetical protein